MSDNNKNTRFDEKESTETESSVLGNRSPYEDALLSGLILLIPFVIGLITVYCWILFMHKTEIVSANINSTQLERRSCPKCIPQPVRRYCTDAFGVSINLENNIIYKYPFMVYLLQQKYIDDKTELHFLCTGIAIQTHWFLTSSKCFQNQSDNRDLTARNFFARSGTDFWSFDGNLHTVTSVTYENDYTSSDPATICVVHVREPFKQTYSISKSRNFFLRQPLLVHMVGMQMNLPFPRTYQPLSDMTHIVNDCSKNQKIAGYFCVKLYQIDYNLCMGGKGFMMFSNNVLIGVQIEDNCQQSLPPIHGAIYFESIMHHIDWIISAVLE